MKPFALVFTSALLVCTHALAITPDDSLREAAKNNPRFQDAGLQIKQSQRNLEGQKSLRPWTFRAEGGVSYDEQPSSGVIEDGTRKTTFGTAGVELLKQFVIGTQLSVRLDWNRSRAEIPFTVPDFNISEIRIIGPNFGGNLSARVTQPLLRNFGSEVGSLPEVAAQTQLTAAELQRERAAHDLVMEVMNAYWSYVRIHMERDALKASLERTAAFAELTIAQIEAGQLAELERDIVQQRVSQAEQALILAETQVVDAWEGLEVAMGRSPGSTPLAYSALNPPIATYTIDELLTKARAANPDLAALAADVRANELNLVRSRNQTRPQLDAVASVSQRSLSDEVGESFTQIAALEYTSFFLGMNFIIPLDNTLATAQLEADEIALERAQLRLREAELMVNRQARQALRLYESQKKRAILSSQEIELARKNLDATNLKYQGGLTSYLEVMELERTLQDAEIRAAQILVDVQLALLGVRRLTGELLTASQLEQLK